MAVKDQITDKVEQIKDNVKEDLDNAKSIEIDWKKVGIAAGSAAALIIGGVVVYKFGIKPKMIVEAASEAAPEIVDAVVETAPEVAEAVL